MFEGKLPQLCTWCQFLFVSSIKGHAASNRRSRSAGWQAGCLSVMTPPPDFQLKNLWAWPQWILKHPHPFPKTGNISKTGMWPKCRHMLWFCQINVQFIIWRHQKICRESGIGWKAFLTSCHILFSQPVFLCLNHSNHSGWYDTTESAFSWSCDHYLLLSCTSWPPETVLSTVRKNTLLWPFDPQSDPNFIQHPNGQHTEQYKTLKW